jgi:hypothetical protein
MSKTNGTQGVSKPVDQHGIIFDGRYLSLKYRIYKYTNYEIKQNKTYP